MWNIISGNYDVKLIIIFSSLQKKGNEKQMREKKHETLRRDKNREKERHYVK